MHTLRTGFKRTDSKKSKGKKGIQTATDLPIDRSAWPILNFRDSNETISKIPLSWKPNSLQDDQQQLISETTQLTGRYIPNDENIEPLAGDSTKCPSREILPGDDMLSHLINPTNRHKSLAEHDKNTRPANSRFLSKAVNNSKWKQAAHTRESKQPLLVEPMNISSKSVFDDRSISSPQINTEWQPIDHAEIVQPLGKESIHHSVGILSSGHSHDFGDRFAIPSWRGKDQPRREESSEETSFQKSMDVDRGNSRDEFLQRSRQVSYVSVTFDPFENSNDIEHPHPQLSGEKIFRSHHDIDTMGRDPQAMPLDSTRMKWARKHNNSRPEIIQSSQCILEEVENVNPREFKNDHIRSHLSDCRFLKEECPSWNDFVVESKPESSKSCNPNSLENRYRKVADHAKRSLQSSLSTAELPALNRTINETREPKTSINFLVTDSTKNFQTSNDSCYPENKCQKDNSVEDGLEFVSNEKEQKISEKEQNTHSAKKIARGPKHIGDCPGKSNKALRESNSLRASLEHREYLKSTSDHNQTSSIISKTIKEEGNQRLRLVVLLSKFSGTLQQRTEQERAISILKGRKISNIEEVDGSSRCNWERRNILFRISGKKGKYPQFFLQNERNVIIYLGDFEWLQYMNDIGSLTDETIYGISDSISLRSERTKTNLVDKMDEGISAFDLRLSKMQNSPFSKRAVALDMYKKDFYAAEKSLCLDFETNTLTLNPKSEVSSENPHPIDEEPDKINLPDKDIEVIGVGEIVHSNNLAGRETSVQESKSSLIHCELSNIDTFECEGLAVKTQGVVAVTESSYDGVCRDDALAGADTYESRDQSPVTPLNATEEELSAERTQAQLCIETITVSLDQYGRKKETKFLDEDPRKSPSESLRSAKTTSIDLKSPDSPCKIPPIQSDQIFADNNEEKDNSAFTKVEKNKKNSKKCEDMECNHKKLKIKENSSRNTDFSSQRKNEIDCCSSFEKPEIPRVGEDNYRSKQNDRHEKRRERWKRMIIAENQKMKTMDDLKLSSTKTEKPIGASCEEIDTINTFLAVVGPDFDRSHTSKELEDVHHRARKAGLSKEITNNMLNQMTGILLWRKNNEPNTMHGQSSPDVNSVEAKRTIVSPTVPASPVDETYDDKGFTRKTPKAESKLDCLVKAFWAESSNIVGREMVENVQAALSGDGESQRGWRSVDMIENIKSTLSTDGCESKKGWRSVDMIQNIKASLSGESSESKMSRQPSNVLESIKAAFSGDSESKVGSWPLEDSNKKARIAVKDINGEGLQSSVAIEIVENKNELDDGRLHEC